MDKSNSLRIRKLKKQYNHQPVLNIPELDLSHGLYVLRGPNGAGKSTFMRILSGIVPAEGDVCLGDISLQKNPILYRKQLAYAEAEPEYPEYVTGRELLRFVCKARAFAQKEAEQLCERLGVDRYYRQPTSGYSSGMRKKLSLVLALANNCSWVLLDEPFNALDEGSRQLVNDIIQERYSGRQTAFLLSAHQKKILLQGEELILVNGNIQKQADIYASVPD